MPNRRELLNAAIGGVLAVELFLIPEAIAASAKRLDLVHGRAQGGLDPQVLKSEWLAALARGNDSFKGSVLKDIEVEFPYYGDLLDGFAARSEIPLTPEVHEKGGPALACIMQRRDVPASVGGAFW